MTPTRAEIEALIASRMDPCGHVESQGAAQLHGVCVFCYRDRGSALVSALRSLLARVAELQSFACKIPTLECPCCGEEGAWATHFEDGAKTTCGCGGIVSADFDEAYIRVDDEEACPKCAALAAAEPKE